MQNGPEISTKNQVILSQEDYARLAILEKQNREKDFEIATPTSYPWDWIWSKQRLRKL
jgi:hypothetical protein